MKRILLSFAALGLMLTANAQMMLQRSIELPSRSAVSDSIRVADSLWWDEQPRWSLNLGISAGATLYNSDNSSSPYYSKYGLQLQVPLMLGWRVSPHWRLGAGLRYDLYWDPLYYAVKVNNVFSDGTYTTNGIDFESIAVEGRQSASVMRHYIGVPLLATWYPVKREPRLLGVTFDLFAGYSFASFIQTTTCWAHYVQYAGYTGLDIDDRSDQTIMNDPTLLPWKLELGVTISSDVLGLLHGVRFFMNLLPTYREPMTGYTLYMHGMTLFL